MKKHNGSNKHFSLRQRNYLEVAIINQISVVEIADFLGFSRQSIYREVKTNSFIKKGRLKQFKNKKEVTCEKLLKFPFVCNVCKARQNCPSLKRYYNAEVAHEHARRTLKESRKGTRLTQEECQKLNLFLLPRMQNGQSLHHIYVSNPGYFKVTERTLRNLINRGDLIIRNYHLPMTVRFKPKKTYQRQRSISRIPEVLLNRTYDDFLDQYTENMHFVQVDSVIGKQQDKKTILTIFFPKFSLMFGFLCHNKTSKEVNNHFFALRAKLGDKLWQKAFPLIVSDRGSEFDRLYLLETAADTETGEVIELTKTFYADPYTSHQRAEIESNHRLIRRLIPKGKSFENLTQEMLDLMFSHINSLIREKQGNKTAYELARDYFGQDFLDLLNIKYIKPENVVLKPDLFLNN